MLPFPDISLSTMGSVFKDILSEDLIQLLKIYMILNPNNVQPVSLK
jgi:hypothetical protein